MSRAHSFAPLSTVAPPPRANARQVFGLRIAATRLPLPTWGSRASTASAAPSRHRLTRAARHRVTRPHPSTQTTKRNNPPCPLAFSLSRCVFRRSRHCLRGSEPPHRGRRLKRRRDVLAAWLLDRQAALDRCARRACAKGAHRQRLASHSRGREAVPTRTGRAGGIAGREDEGRAARRTR